MIVMTDIGWDRPQDGELRWADEEVLTRALKRTRSAFKQLEATRHRSGVPWVLVDHGNNLIALPRRVAHLLPDNRNIVQGWLNQLREIPPSLGRDAWLISTFRILRVAFGRDDPRLNLMTSEYRTALERSGAQLSEFADERETVTPNPSPNGSVRGSAKILDGRSEMGDLLVQTDLAIEKKHSRSDAPRRDERAPASSFPPPDASDRLRAIFKAMTEVTFLVPGKGEQTIWQNAKRPEALATKLDESCPGVNVPALIGKLGGWTFANPKRSKRDLARFVWNAASREQDNPRSPATQEAYRHGTDLAQKVRGRRK